MNNKIKSLFAKILANNYTGYIIGRTVRYINVFNSLKIDISSPFVSNTIKSYLFWGMYESAESRCIQKYMIDDLPVVELGASMGVITALISKRNPPLHVAVEGNPNMIALIKRNIEINGLSQPEIINKVISYTGDSTVKFRLSTDNTGSSISNETRPGTADSIVEVDSITLSQLLEERSIEKYVLIADIEGAEASIFYHDQSAIIGKCAMIIIELHNTFFEGREVTIKSIVNLLSGEYNFKISAVDGDVYVFEQNN